MQLVCPLYCIVIKGVRIAVCQFVLSTKTIMLSSETFGSVFLAPFLVPFDTPVTSEFEFLFFLQSPSSPRTSNDDPMTRAAFVFFPYHFTYPMQPHFFIILSRFSPRISTLCPARPRLRHPQRVAAGRRAAKLRNLFGGYD